MSAFSNKYSFDDVEFVSYTDESMLPDIMRLVSADLSEPYSVFVYRYFIHQWPELCICVYNNPPNKQPKDPKQKEMIAVIVSKSDEEGEAGTLRGYIAMLAVNTKHRNRGLGLELANRGISKMVSNGCKEIMLEGKEKGKGKERKRKWNSESDLHT